MSKALSPREIREKAEREKINAQNRVQNNGNGSDDFLNDLNNGNGSDNGTDGHTPEYAQECLNLMLTGQDSPLTYAECFAILKNANPDDMQEITGAEMLKFENGVTYDMLIFGIEENKSIKGKRVPVVLMKDENGNSYISGAAVLVSAVREHSQFLPDFFKITCKGKSVSANGDYYDLQILKFKQKG